MYAQKMFVVELAIAANNDLFQKTLNSVERGGILIKTGESLLHMALKSIATDYLIKSCGLKRDYISYEYPLIGFEVDLIDKNLFYPSECGDTNAQKLEKFLALPTTKIFFIFPYPHTGDVKVYQFIALPLFFEYLEHKNSFLNNQRAKWR